MRVHNDASFFVAISLLVLHSPKCIVYFFAFFGRRILLRLNIKRFNTKKYFIFCLVIAIPGVSLGVWLYSSSYTFDDDPASQRRLKRPACVCLLAANIKLMLVYDGNKAFEWVAWIDFYTLEQISITFHVLSSVNGAQYPWDIDRLVLTCVRFS